MLRPRLRSTLPHRVEPQLRFRSVHAWLAARFARPQGAAEAAFELVNKRGGAERAAGRFRCAQSHERGGLGFDADQVDAAPDAVDERLDRHQGIVAAFGVRPRARPCPVPRKRCGDPTFF